MAQRILDRLEPLRLERLEPRLALAVDTGNARPYWGNGHYYAFTQEDIEWSKAYDNARSTTLSQLDTKGYLATITSSGENDFITSYSRGGNAITRTAHLGGTDEAAEGTWKWKAPDSGDDGVEFRKNSSTPSGVYANWSNKQPDNSKNQDFLGIQTDGKWDDVDHDNDIQAYVTEWGRSGVEFTASFAELGSSNTVNGMENGQAAKMTISFDRKVPNDYVDIRNDTPLIDIPITFSGNATAGTDYDMSVSGGSSSFKDGRLYVRNTQTVTLTFTPKNNTAWKSPRTIKATLGSDGDEKIFGIGNTATSQVWIYDDEPLLSLGQGAYQFIRAPYTAGSSQTLPTYNTDFRTSADTLIFDTSGIDESDSSFSDQGFYDSFAMRWETYVRIPETGSYTFRTSSDDGHRLVVKRNDNSGADLATISNWSDGSKTGSTPAVSLTKGDVVWVQFDMYEKSGTASARLLWDRPDGSGGTTTNQVIPASAMFLSKGLAAGVNRTESASSDTRALGFQLFANKSSSVDLNVRLASSSETSNSTVDTSLAQRRTNSGVVGDDYALWDDASAGSQIGTSLIGLNDSYATTVWKPDQAAGSLANVKSYYVQVLTDSYAEATESITLRLGSNTGYGVSNDSQSVAIADSPFVLKVKAGQNPQEGKGDEGDLGWFTITTGDRAAPAGMRVKYAITGGTASRNSDFTAPQATLSTTSYKAEDLVVIPTGATEAKIYIAALADAIREGDETVVLELKTNVEKDDQNFTFQRYGVDASAKQATLTIRDSEAFTAAVVTTPADRTGQSTVRARLTDGSQVASFDVHVTSQPTSDVTGKLTTTSGSLSSQTLTFTGSNWTQPQRVTLTGVGTNQATTVQLTSTSGDSRYHNTSTQQRVVPSSWSSELEISLWEGGTVLAAQPAASVAAIDGTEGTTSRFGFELSLGAEATSSPVELLYTLAAGSGMAISGAAADVRHEPDATYRPLVLANSGSGDAAFANLGSFTTVSDAGELSAQAWVWRDKADAGDTVVEFSNASNQHRIWLGFPDSTNKPRLELRSSSGAVLAQLTSDAPLALAEWNHLAFSIDKNKVASLYVNGELVARQTLASGLSRLARSSNLLGRSQGGERLDGAMRAVAIWNAARSQDEIRASMLEETASGSGLVSSLPLNNSLANGVSSAPAAVLSSNSSNTAAFATTPIYALRLSAGTSRVGVPLVVLDDLTAENDESLTLTLVDSGSYSLGGSSGTGTAELADDDSADVEFLAAWSNLDGSETGWTSTGRFTVSESDQAGSTQTRLGIRLTSRPTETVTLRLKSNTATSGDIRTTLASSPNAARIELTFTPDNWDQVQELRLQGRDDTSVDGDIERSLDFTITTSDAFYKALTPSVTVLVLDDDTLTANEDLGAGQNAQAPLAEISAPTRNGGSAAAVDLKINFQKQGAETPSGYLADSGSVYGDRGNSQTYGWSTDHTDLGRDRGVNADQTVDTLVHFREGATWEISLPNGAYRVTASVGDAGFSSTHTLNVEGFSFFSSRSLSADEFARASATVTVSDGRLTLDQGSAANKATRLNFIEISSITGIAESGSDAAQFTITLSQAAAQDTLVFFDLEQSNRQLNARDFAVVPSQNAQALGGLARLAAAEATDLKINFQKQGAETPSGYLADSGSVYGDRGNGRTYGWSSDHTEMGRDRNKNSDQKLDTLVGIKNGQTWEIALANGVYEVSASIGDSEFTGTHTLNIEGVSYFSARALAANEFAFLKASVTVNDGRLTMDAGSSSATRINYLEIKSSGTTNAETVSFDADGINETASTFPAAGGGFTTTWSGYVAIPETGSYTFTVPVRGGVRLSLDGTTVIDQWFDTQATWSTETLQLSRGDFVAITLDYKSFNTTSPAVALQWERPRNNGADTVTETIPADAFSRVDGIHLVIAAGSTSASVTVRGLDDSIDEDDETLVVRMLAARGVEIVVKSQNDATGGRKQLELALGTTDREAVTLAAGTVLALGRSVDVTGSKGSTAARFTVAESVTLRRDRKGAVTGTLAWVDEATQTSLAGSVVDLVASVQNDLYQVLDRSVTMTLTAPLAADSAAGSNRYRAALSLGSTNRSSVELAAGTKLVYRNDSTGDTATLVLVNSLTLTSGQAVASVPVWVEMVTLGLDLTSSTSPLTGLTSRVDLPTSATLTITDDDTAGITLFADEAGTQAVDGSSRVNLAEQGTSLTRYVRLTSQPDDSVTVYFETNDASEARLQIPASSPEDPSARIALTFTPENWKVLQAFRIVPTDDRLVDGSQNVEIHSRTTSSDPFYAIRAAGIQKLSVADNDTSGVKVELQQSSITKAGNGFINLSLTAEPTADVVVTLSPSDRQFTINDRSVGRSETLVFTPANWSTLQTVGLYAIDDNAVEDVSTSSLTFATTSADARFHALSVDTVSIVITDNDLPTATLERVSDGAEEGKPGRFRIRLSDAAASSVGSKGLVVNYTVTAVDLDSSLPYGTSVGGRLGKIAQTPTSVSGTVRIPPGRSLSDVLVVPIDDFLADSTSKSITIALASGDGYTVASDNSRTSATVKLVNNDVAGILVMTSGERVFVKESGSAATYQLALTSEPKSTVTLTITEKVSSGASRQLGTSSTSFSTTVTFTRDNWFTPQQISVRAYDDYKIEDGSGSTAKTGIHAAQLAYTFNSSDTDYNTASHSGDSNHFTNFVQSVDVLDYELADTTATSMQSSLTSLQEGIESLSLPMVGSLTGKTGKGLRKFINDLTNSIRSVGTPTPARLSRLITRDIASALGVSENAISVNLSMKDTSTTNPAVVVRFGFSDAYTVFSVPLAADFGLPGLGFQTEGSFDASFSYDAGLELVFPRSGDIYLNTAADKTFVTANFNAGVSDDFRLTGGLGFMQLDAVNQPSVNDNVQIGDEPASTELDVSFELFVNGGAGEDGTLTYSELTSSSLDLEEVFQYSFSGNAAMSFGVTTSVNGSAAIPSFKFELSALLPLFDYSNQEQADEPSSATTFYFDNIRLDLGSYITDMLSPIVDGLDDVLKPLYPLVDALYKDTKIFATVGLESTFDVDEDGQTSTIDLSRWFAGFYATIDQGKGQKLAQSVEDTVEFLDMLKGVMDLVRDLERLSDEEGFYVSFGSYELAAWNAGDDDADPAEEEVDEDAESLEDDTKEQADKGGKDKDGKSKNAFAKVMEQLDELGITIPLIEEPANAIKLLFGQDVSLFEWRMPGMGMSSEIDKTFPIYGGIEGVIEGGYEVEAHLGFGFDTYGLSQWRRDDFAAASSWKVFNGFYVADLDKNGKDIPEFTMDASMGAGLGYSARVVRADITGGLEAAASLDLLDEGEIAGTSDGKIRGREITDRISNPLSLFELSGELIAYVKSRVQIGVDLGFYSIWKTVWERRLAEIPLFKFGIGGRYGSGTASNGHLQGSTVFFDANFNGRIDSLEPVAVTDADGRYSLDVDLRTFDSNRNGRIDDSEGRLVVFGGIDTTMNRPLALPLVAPLGAMVTPLTTIASLAGRSGIASDRVDAFLRQAFGLGQFDYMGRDPLAVLQAATSFDDPATRDALATYFAHIRLHLMGDLVTGATQSLLPDLVPGTLAAELNMLAGTLPVLLQKPETMSVEAYLDDALNEVWRTMNPQGDPTTTALAAKVGELVSRASREVATRLDALRSEAFRTGASPADLLATIHELKQQAFTLFRTGFAGLSEGLYRITDPDELERVVTARLREAQGDFINEAPTAVSVTAVAATLPENTSTASRVKVADIVVVDDGKGTNVLVLGGRDAALFEIAGRELFLRAGTILDFETHPSVSVTVSVTDLTASSDGPPGADFMLTVTNVKEAPTIALPAAGFQVVEDTRGPLVFPAAPFGTSDALPTKRVTVTLAVPRGAIKATSAAGVTVGGTPRAATFSGTLAALNRFFTNPSGLIAYRPKANDNLPVTLTVTVLEQTRQGPLESSAIGTILITPVNDLPVVQAPAGFRVVEDVRGPLSWSAIAMPFADVDSPVLTVTLAVDDGTIDAASDAGVVVGGTGAARTFTGPTAAINAYFRSLGRIGYTTARDNTAARALRTTVFDGHDAVTVSSLIRITPVNDAPTIAPAATLPGLAAGRRLVITHAMLVAASKARDPEGAALTFRLLSLESGRLEKWIGNGWATMLVGAQAAQVGFAPPAVIRPGERIRWTPPTAAAGRTPAFTIRANDGELPSDAALVAIDLGG